MRNHDKTKKELINELAKLRQRIAELEVSETERKKAEEILRREKDWREQYLNIAGVMLVIVNADEKITMINKKGSEILGYKEKELIGKNWFDLLVPQRIRDEVKDVFHKLMAGDIRPVEYYENPLLTKDGEERLVAFHNTVIRGPNDQIVGVLFSAEDITERKKMEQQLEESRRHFETLFNFVADPVVIVSGKGKLLEVTDRVQEITGFKKEELVGKSFMKVKILTVKSKAIAIKNLAKRMMGMKIAPYEVEVLTKDGKKMPYEINAARIDYRGKPADMVVFRDITERKKIQEELQGTLKKLRGALGATIQAMALTVETRDAYTAGHQRRVTNLARAIATEMKLSKDQIDGIRTAGTIHDLGKIGVPAEILNKPVRLTDIEFNLIKIHPLVGYNILKQIEFPWPVAEIVLQHHERINGSGYPRGLSDGNILLEAKILGVADVVEAMASHRPYRPALGIDKALEEISQNKGVLYDPQVVDTCLKVFRKKRFKFE